MWGQLHPKHLDNQLKKRVTFTKSWKIILIVIIFQFNWNSLSSVSFITCLSKSGEGGGGANRWYFHLLYVKFYKCLSLIDDTGTCLWCVHGMLWSILMIPVWTRPLISVQKFWMGHILALPFTQRLRSRYSFFCKWIYTRVYYV